MAGTKHNEKDQNQQREEPTAAARAEHKRDVGKELKGENRTGNEGRHGRHPGRGQHAHHSGDGA